MPLLDPTKLVNPYADGFNTWALPAETKLETGTPDGYELETKGIRAENFQTIIRNRGELETETVTGQYYVKSATVHNEQETYQQDITYLDIGAGETALIPVTDAPVQEEGFDANAQIVEEAEYQAEQSSVQTETGADYNIYEERSSFYTNESGEHFIPHEVNYYPVDPDTYNPEYYETY